MRTLYYLYMRIKDIHQTISNIEIILSTIDIIKYHSTIGESGAHWQWRFSNFNKLLPTYMQTFSENLNEIHALVSKLHCKASTGEI